MLMRPGPAGVRPIEDPVTKAMITAAINIHRRLGPGLLESTYRACLCYELQKMQFEIMVEPRLSITYDDLVISNAYRLDLVVAGTVVVELKHVEKLLAIHEAQLRTYLKLSGMTCGILLNFNSAVMKNGIRRLDLPVVSRAVHPGRL